jgi:hypothetical protein
MATRFAEPEPWCRVAAVLAEAAGVDESRSFDVAALAQAKQMRGIRYDWAGRPTCTWSAAAELLASLRAEQARMLAEVEERLVAADQAFRASLPAGIPAGAIPPGMTGGQLMMAADPMRGSRRESVVHHALANPDGAILYHPLQPEQAGQ